MVETCSPYSLVQEVRCNNRYSMEYLPSRLMVSLRHIAGEYNISDWGTCMYMLGDKTACYADQVEQFLPILICFNFIESSESTEVIPYMGVDVTPEEDTKPYPDQVYGGRVIHFSSRQDLAAAEQVLPRQHDHT